MLPTLIELCVPVTLFYNLVNKNFSYSFELCNCFSDTGSACLSAVINGHVNCLRYARKQNCPWSKETFYIVIEYGHVDSLQFLFENKCPFQHGIAHKIAVEINSSCLDFIHRNLGCYSNVRAVIKSNHMPCITHWKTYNVQYLCKEAIRKSDTEYFQDLLNAFQFP